jgi:hypothetical protein
MADVQGQANEGNGTAAASAPSGDRCYVLVAKALTKSDTAGRVILPRVSVEANLSFLMGYRRVF